MGSPEMAFGCAPLLPSTRTTGTMSRLSLHRCWADKHTTTDVLILRWTVTFSTETNFFYFLQAMSRGKMDLSLGWHVVCFGLT